MEFLPSSNGKVTMWVPFWMKIMPSMWKNKHLSTNSCDVLESPGRDGAPDDGMLGNHITKTTNKELGPISPIRS